MSMLAERKHKQKWSLNPRGKEWSEDANKFGQKMLEKMGWQSGKGLGANENGITEHVKISYKNDSKGMGYKESNDQWTEHETHFSALLESLGGKEHNLEGKKVSSLEQKSQTSRARVHYHKFTRGKDLSRYSEKDLANIFGKKSLKESKKVEVKKDSNSDSKEIEKSNGFLINSGSMRDYFKKKLTNFGTSNGYIIGQNGVLQKEDSECENDNRPAFGFGFNSSKITENSESESEMRTTFGFGSNMSESSSKKSKTKRDAQESESNLKTSKMSFVSYISETSSNKRTTDESEDTVFSPKKKSKKEKQKSQENLGLSNPAFNPMSTPIRIQKHSLNTITECLNEEVDENIIEFDSKNGSRNRTFDTASSSFEATLENPKADTERSTKKKKKSGEFNNPNFNEEAEQSIEGEYAEENPYEISTKKLKKGKKKKTKQEYLEETNDKTDKTEVTGIALEQYNPVFNDTEDISTNCLQIKENPYEVKVKKKKKRKTKELEVDNPNFDDTENNSTHLSQIDENPYEIKPNEKRKKKKDKKIVLANPSFSDESEKFVQSINPYEIKPKKKIKVNDNVGISNPALDLNNSKNEESTILEDCDLMLNVISSPVQKEKSSSSVSVGSMYKVDSIKNRKSVRFSNVTQELIIPNNEELDEAYGKKGKNKKKKKGLDNINFDKQQTNLDENVDTIAKTLDSYQAEIENDINEDKIKTFTADDLMVGEVGNPQGENEKLKEGTKLKFKYASLDTKTPFYMLDKIGARKSYKHLIKGDIVLKFKNSNLHEIKGYRHKATNKV